MRWLSKKNVSTGGSKVLLSNLARAKTRRLILGLATTVTAVIGLGLVSAGPAAAADPIGVGTWVTYGTKNPITSSTSTWKCGATKPVATSVSAQTCAIRSAGGASVQAAVIVRNNGASAYNAYAYVALYDYETIEPLYAWDCGFKDLAPGGWSVCFGNTWSWSWSVYVLYAALNGVSLGESPVV
jgi:hypothetical protein